MKITVSVVSDAKNFQSSVLKRRTLHYAREIIKKLVLRRELKFLSKRKELLLGVRLAGPAASKRLNKTYRGKKHATNVLSFPTYSSVLTLKKNKESIIDLGDIVLSVSVITRDAHDSGKSFYTQFFWTLSHGILHTLGYDHERSTSEAKMSEKLEAQLLTQFRP